MTDKSAKTPEKKPEEAAAAISPESSLEAKVKELQAEADKLTQEIKTLQGQISNRNPAMLQTLKNENDQLKKQEALLRQALLGLYLDQTKPRTSDELKQEYEILKNAAVDYFKRANVNPEIWKNIVS